MAKSRRLLLHLAAGLAGWGIVTALKPARPAAADSRAATKTSFRDTHDREQGGKLLNRFAPDIVPAAPVEVRHHEGNWEELVRNHFKHDAFGNENFEVNDWYIVGYLQNEIRGMLCGEDGPDLSYAFKHGRMEAKDVLVALNRIFPDLSREGYFAKALFLELIKIDPTRAAPLLDGFSPEERKELIRYESRVMSGDLDPFVSLARVNLGLLHSLEPFNALREKNIPDLTHGFREEYGSDYTEWLLDQPPSKGREAMVEALMEQLVMEDPAAAGSLRKRLSTR